MYGKIVLFNGDVFPVEEGRANHEFLRFYGVVVGVEHQVILGTRRGLFLFGGNL